MRLRPPVFLGSCIGLAGALLVIGYATGRLPEPATMLPDYGGPVRAVVMQYATGSQYVLPVFRDYLKWQGPEVTVYMACSGPDEFNEVRGLLGDAAARCKIVPVYTGHPQTAWSRDRWVALVGEKTGRPTLLSPKGENGEDVWFERAGDSHIGDDLAKFFPAVFAARRSNLFFDGGDYLADDGRVFVTRGVITRNVQHTAASRDDLARQIAGDLGLAPIFLDDGPDHHAGMFMMSAGPSAGTDPRRVMIVADPSMGRTVYAQSTENDALFKDGPDFSPETQHQFDSVAAVVEKAGYRVVRIPVVPGHGKMYMTYVNVILDQAPAAAPHAPPARIVYMSSYQGQERMNASAAAVWESLGYVVRPVDCTTVWQKGGTLHCLVNVFQRAK